MSLKVYLPWWAASYIPLNGYHPIYKYICDGNGKNQYLTSSPAHLLSVKHEWPKSYSSSYRGPSSKYRQMYDDFFVQEELEFVNEIKADLHFYHSAPSFYGSKNFILHVESFLPIFMPFAFQGVGFVVNPDDVKSSYKRLFESEKCVAIFSHVKQTLNEVSLFFSSETIDKKLVYLPLGFLGEDNIHDSNQENIKKEFRISEDAYVFLYNNSASQSETQFVMRGGIVSLLAACQILKLHPRSIFIFRCPKPNFDDFAKYGIDTEYLDKISGSSIYWIEEFLEEKKMVELYQIADFNLLISANLHSNTILKSMHYSCVPIVTDTIGTEEYVSDMHDGIVLNGVRDVVWKFNDSHGYWHDDHEVFDDIDLFNSLADQLIYKLGLIFAQPNKLAKLKFESKLRCDTEHNSKARLAEMEDKILKLMNQNLPIRVFSDSMMTSLSKKYFTGCTTPMIINDIGKIRIISFQGLYYLQLLNKPNNSLNVYSILGSNNGGKHTWPVYSGYEDALAGAEFFLNNFDSFAQDHKLNTLDSLKSAIKNKFPKIFSKMKYIKQLMSFS